MLIFCFTLNPQPQSYLKKQSADIKKQTLHMGVKVQQKQQTVIPFGEISFVNDKFTRS
jgi:hypothetical protein